MANMVILKRPREDEVKSKYIDHIITTTTSQKLESVRISKAKSFCPTSVVMKPLAKKIALILYLLPSLLENNNIKDSMIVTGCRCERGDVFPLSHEKRI